jgi:aldose sugar dehydrogenase
MWHGSRNRLLLMIEMLMRILFLILILNLLNMLSFISYGNTVFGASNTHVTMNDPKLKAEVVFSGIKFPTSMAFLGPNDILVIEKNSGTVHRIINGTIIQKPLLDINVANKGERGLLGISVAKHEKNEPPYVLLYFTESVNKDGDDVSEGKSPLGNRLYRYELADDKLGNPKLLLDLPVKPDAGHNGGKIVLGHDDNVYLVIGDLGVGDLETQAQSKSQNIKNGSDPDGSAGILRITLDGKPVGPLIGKKDPLNKYYAYGLRNSFGIAFDPVTGKLWDTENGPGFGDEINLVEPGFNSGWMKVQGIWQNPIGEPYGTVGDVSVDPEQQLIDFNGKGKYSDPEFTWKGTVGPTGITFLNSDRLGQKYKNDMFMGDFHNGYLYHFDLNKKRTELSLKGLLNDKVANNIDELKQIIFAKGFGGITDIKVGPEGNLYVLSIHEGGHDCRAVANLTHPCVSYNSEIEGTIFRIVEANETTDNNGGNDNDGKFNR